MRNTIAVLSAVTVIFLITIGWANGQGYMPAGGGSPFPFVSSNPAIIQPPNTGNSNTSDVVDIYARDGSAAGIMFWNGDVGIPHGLTVNALTNYGSSVLNGAVALSPPSGQIGISISQASGSTSNFFQTTPNGAGSPSVYIDGEGDLGANVLELPIQSIAAGSTLVEHDNASINLTGTAADTTLCQASTALNHVIWIRNGSNGTLNLVCHAGDTIYDSNVFYTSLKMYGGDSICLQAQASGAWQILARNTLQPSSLLPSGAPAAPASGWILYTDSGDGNKLKAVASTGTVVTLGVP